MSLASKRVVRGLCNWLLFVGVLLCTVRAEASPQPAQRVVVVVLGGGVRPLDVAHAERMPALHAWSQRDVLRIPGIESGARSLDEALARLLSGSPAYEEHGQALRPRVRTILDRADGWFVSHAAGTALQPATHRLPADPGRPPPGRFAMGAGAFAEPLAPLLEAWGRPLPAEGRAAELLAGLRAHHRREAATALPADVRLGLPAFDRVEQAVLAELDRRSLVRHGPLVHDARTLAMAATVLEVYRPGLLVVRLADLAVADASEARYLEVVSALDRELAVWLRTIDAAQEGATRAAIVVVSDRARRRVAEADGRLLEARGPREDDGSVALVRAPSGVLRMPPAPRRLEDVAPTVAAWLRLEAEPGVEGRSWQ